MLVISQLFQACLLPPVRSYMLCRKKDVLFSDFSKETEDEFSPKHALLIFFCGLAMIFIILINTSIMILPSLVQTGCLHKKSSQKWLKQATFDYIYIHWGKIQHSAAAVPYSHWVNNSTNRWPTMPLHFNKEVVAWHAVHFPHSCVLFLLRRSLLKWEMIWHR